MARAKDLADFTNRVVELGCIVRPLDKSRPRCRRPAVPHHIYFEALGMKADDWLIIPLCPAHHTAGGIGEAIHACRETWESLYGTETHYLELTRELVAKDRWWS